MSLSLSTPLNVHVCSVVVSVRRSRACFEALTIRQVLNALSKLALASTEVPEKNGAVKGFENGNVWNGEGAAKGEECLI